jgi:inorganic pyrophosphatase
MFRMRDEMGLDDKVCAWRRLIRGWRSWATLRRSREFDRLEIRHFFEAYTALEPGQEAGTSAWADQAAALSEIEACRQRARSAGHQGGSGGPAGQGNPGSRRVVRDGF